MAEESEVQPVNKTYNTIEPQVEAKRIPRRVLHFSDGVIEEFSTDDEAEREEEEQRQKEAWQKWRAERVEQLRIENNRLRSENQFLSLVPGPTEGHFGPDKLIVTGLVHQEPIFDEHLVNEIVEEVFSQ